MNFKSTSGPMRLSVVASVLATSITAHAAPQSFSSSTFTMRDSTGSIVGVPDSSVTGNYDLANRTFSLASTTPFFGVPWTTHDGTLYPPGDHTISTADTSGNTCGASYSICASAGNVTFTVPAGHVGARIKFAWGATDGIDVLLIWDSSGNSIDFGATGIAADGIDGFKMVDGPFIGFSADFDVTPSPANVTSPTASSANLTVAPNAATNAWTPSVTNISSSSSTCAITSAAGSGTATIASDCSSGNFDSSGMGLGATTSFQYTATDSFFGTTSSATVTVTADPDYPVASNGTATANGTTATLISLANLVSDANNNVTTYTVVSNPTHGTLVNNNDGTVTYTGNAGYSGVDSFTYKATDATAKTSGTATVTVNVKATTPAVTTGTYSIGTVASSNSSTTGGGLTVAMVGTDSDLYQQCVGGCFDFKVSGVGAGGTATVVLPLSSAIPAKDPYHQKITYRKLISGSWKDFDTSGSNAIASAAAISTSPTVCPEPGSSSYQSGLTSGHYCIQLSIVDGGPNDADGDATNGIVVDPGGIGVGTSVTSSVSDPSFEGGASGGGGGCTLNSTRGPVGLEWLALAATIVGFRVLRKRPQA